jgi:hypothetical protein
MMLDDRERTVLETLDTLPKQNLVLIGGYAVNAYVPPRFSIDCDVVILDNVSEIESFLMKRDFAKAESGNVAFGSYIRFEMEESKVSFDLLIGSVVDRDTGTVFEDELFRKHSAERITVGRVAPIRIKIRIADPELLFSMKFVSARKQDVRDIFMLAGGEPNWRLTRKLISVRCDVELIKKRVELVKSSVESKDFRDSIQGPFGKIPDGRFNLCKGNLVEFLERLLSVA